MPNPERTRHVIATLAQPDGRPAIVIDLGAGLRADLATMADSDPAVWWLDGQPFPQEEAETKLTELVAGLTQRYATEDFPVATYRGLSVVLRLHSMAHPQVLVRGQITYDAPLDLRGSRGRGITRAVLHLLRNYPGWEQGLVGEIERQQRRLERAGSAIGQDWPHVQYLAQLTSLRQELQLALRADSPEETRDASDVVADITALQAKQQVSTADASVSPERTLSIAPSLAAQIRARHEATDSGVAV